MTDAASVRLRLASAEAETRRRATQEIPSVPAPEASELLLLALADEDWRVRKEAASMAARVEPRTAVVFAVARALAEHENVGLRNAAVEALILIGPDAVPGAIDALGRLDADGRKLAIEVLAGAPTLAGMRTLVRSTVDPDVNVVIAAAEALGKAHLAGDEAREIADQTLAKLLASDNLQIRLAALASLRESEADVPFSTLEPLLGDALLRRNALLVAGGSRAPRALLALAEAVTDPNPTVARDATLALALSLEASWEEPELVEVAGRTLRASATARKRLRALAKDPDAAVRSAAILALGLVRDPDDVGLLADALADDAVATYAEAALHLFGQDAVEPLLVAGRSAAPSLRGATISMLPQLAPRESEPLAAVRDALEDEAPEVVAPALKSLAIVGGPSDLAPISGHVAHADPMVAAAAHGALLAVASRHASAARSMIAGVDPRGDLALSTTIIIDALARTDASEPADAEFLSSALTHREAAVRRAAIDALASMGGDDAAQAVTFSLADEEPIVALAAIRALGRLGRAEQLATLAATTRDPMRLATILRALAEADPARAFAAARPLLRSPEASIAAAAVDVVGVTSTEGRLEALLSAMDHPDNEVVKLALGQLVRSEDDRAFAAVTRAVEHGAESVRRYAAELLGQEGGVEAETILRARLDREPSVVVRQTIMTALSARPSSSGGAPT